MSVTPKKQILLASALGARADLTPTETRRLFPEESQCLAATGVGPVIIGLTPGVNDESAQFVHKFQPTRYELAVLAVHYFDEARAIEHFWEWADQESSTETRMRAFAYGRLDTIAECLGEEDFEQAVSETKAKWNAKFTDLALCPRCERCGLKHQPVCGCNDCLRAHEPSECPSRLRA